MTWKRRVFGNTPKALSTRICTEMSPLECNLISSQQTYFFLPFYSVCCPKANLKPNALLLSYLNYLIFWESYHSERELIIWGGFYSPAMGIFSFMSIYQQTSDENQRTDLYRGRKGLVHQRVHWLESMKNLAKAFADFYLHCGNIFFLSFSPSFSSTCDLKNTVRMSHVKHRPLQCLTCKQISSQ